MYPYVRACIGCEGKQGLTLGESSYIDGQAVGMVGTRDTNKHVQTRKEKIPKKTIETLYLTTVH